MALVLRTSGDPDALAASVRSAVTSLDREVPLANVQTMEASMGSWAAERRLVMLLVSAFALLALALGAVGIYGVMAHLVTQREREIGVRIALGAMPREILRLVARQGMAMIGAGLALGTVGSLVATRLIAGLLYDVRPTDPATMVATALTLALVGAMAMLVPAVRATRADPPTRSGASDDRLAAGPRLRRPRAPPDARLHARRDRHARPSASGRRPPSSRW